MASSVEFQTSLLQLLELAGASGLGMSCESLRPVSGSIWVGVLSSLTGGFSALIYLGENVSSAEGGVIQEVMGEALSGQTTAAWLPLQFLTLHHPSESPHSALLPFLSAMLSCRTPGTGPGAFIGICAVCGAWPDLS